MRLPVLAFAISLTASACGEADAPVDAPPATPAEVADAVTPEDAPAETAEAADPVEESDADNATSDTPLPVAGEENDVREAVYGFLVESVMDGPQPPELEAWDDAVNIEGTAAYYVGMPALAADVEAFESYCAGIASVIGPDESGIVRAYLRRGTAGGWTVIDYELCYPDGSWQTWEEEYSLPAGLVVEAP